MKRINALRLPLLTISFAFVIAFLFAPMIFVDGNHVVHAQTKVDGSAGAPTKVDGSDGAPKKVDGSDGVKTVPTKSGASLEKIKNPLGQGANLDSIIRKILSGINVIAAMVVTFFIILGGFKYVTAMGDEKKITDAHNTLKWTVIGAAILFGAQVIANIIQNTVTELSKVK